MTEPTWRGVVCSRPCYGAPCDLAGGCYFAAGEQGKTPEFDDAVRAHQAEVDRAGDPKRLIEK